MNFNEKSACLTRFLILFETNEDVQPNMSAVIPEYQPSDSS